MRYTDDQFFLCIIGHEFYNCGDPKSEDKGTRLEQVAKNMNYPMRRATGPRWGEIDFHYRPRVVQLRPSKNCGKRDATWAFGRKYELFEMNRATVLY